MSEDVWIRAELSTLANAGLLRRERVADAAGGRFESAGRTVLNFSSNDYLNLARDPRLIEAAADQARRFGAGAGASRLVTGTLPCHLALEEQLALHKGSAAALVFGSGFLANLGVITACVGPGDTVFADRLAHASLLDGAQLSRARLHRFRHNDPGHLADCLRRHGGPGRRLIVTESVFSMDGDLAPLADIAQLARAHDALLLVDEAHATGVFGPQGAGLAAHLGVAREVTLSVGTLSKALGGYGGFVACSAAMREFIVNRARPYIYTTALPPAAVGAALAALEVLHSEPGRGAELLARAARLRAMLAQRGLRTGDSASQILPIMLGDADRAVRISERLRAQGLLGVAMRPPTVPRGTSRLRLSVTLAHALPDLEYAADRIVEAVKSA